MKIGCGVIVVMCRHSAIIMVSSDNFYRAVMLRSARLLAHGRHALQGQGGNDEPDQQCLQNANHLYSLAWAC